MPDSLTLTSTETWKKYTILIVDDEQAILDELESILKLEGYNVATALSGEEGLQRLRDIPAKLVISDQKMAGGMSGTEFLSRAKTDSPDILTMILSAFSEPEYLMAAVNNANVYQYVLKPWNQEDLLHRVSQALQYYHAQAECKRLAQANERLLNKMTLMENFSLIGDFSTALYERFFPILQTTLRANSSHAGEFDDPNETAVDKGEWSHLGTIVSRLGQVGLFYHLPPGFQSCAVSPIVENCVAEARQITEKLGIEWIEEYEPGLPELLIQSDTFSFAIKALIENAVIFNLPMPHEPPTPRVMVRVYRDATSHSSLIIEVKDNGKGCNESDKIFSPLYSTSPQHTAPWIKRNSLDQYNFESYNHVGLGLPIARWCITQHDGTVTLANPGKIGALFRIEIPLSQNDLRQHIGI